MAQVITMVMASVAEAELGALFINAKEEVHIHNILAEMGHPQPQIPIQTDNLTAEGVLNNCVHKKHTKLMDMWLH